MKEEKEVKEGEQEHGDEIKQIDTSFKVKNIE
jgi:hypothetical protein